VLVFFLVVFLSVLFLYWIFEDDFANPRAAIEINAQTSVNKILRFFVL
jgi:hypothetical protein